MTTYSVILLPHFKRQLKSHLKKHRHLVDDIKTTLATFTPVVHTHLGNNLYKVRLATQTLARGKNKSFRLIILLEVVNSFLVPVTVYYKGDQAVISKKELALHLKSILFELRSNIY